MSRWWAPAARSVELMLEALEMTELLSTRTENEDMKKLAMRIAVSQTDEIKMMKQWLTERGKPTEMPMDHSHMAGMDMKGMDMKNMKNMKMSDMMPKTMKPKVCR